MQKSTLILLALVGAGIVLTGGGIVGYEIATNGEQYLPLIQAAASQFGVPWPLLAAQLQQESNFNPNAVSSAGAQGIAQFMPETATQYGITNPFDPTQEIPAQANLMSDLYAQFSNSWTTALAAYNWGAGNVQNAMDTYGDQWLAYAPEETQNYVDTITTNSGIS